jgi:SAM-dependent methyltransferase
MEVAMSRTLLETIANLTRSADALAAIGAALDARVSNAPLDPAIRPHVEAVLSAHGISLDSVPKAEIGPMLGQIRTFALANTKLLFAAGRSDGWSHTEPELLQAAGDASARFPERLKSSIAPQLEGLSARLASPDAAFLDIGVGVAALSMAMAATWPNLRITGIDPWAPSIAMAHTAVAAAGLSDRIMLREQSAEDMEDRDAFDLAWLPSLFVPRDAVPAVLHRVLAALRPGGWLLVPILRPVDDPLTTALAQLRVALFGGYAWPEDELTTALRGKGYVDVRTLAPSPQAVNALVVGRKP